MWASHFNPFLQKTQQFCSKPNQSLKTHLRGKYYIDIIKVIIVNVFDFGGEMHSFCGSTID